MAPLIEKEFFRNTLQGENIFEMFKIQERHSMQHWKKRVKIRATPTLPRATAPSIPFPRRRQTP